MIISGANAGGKTVVLKTAGLLSLMAISGLPVPAAEAKIPFYRSVLADIGDHQSLARKSFDILLAHVEHRRDDPRMSCRRRSSCSTKPARAPTPRKARHSALRSSIIFAGNASPGHRLDPLSRPEDVCRQRRKRHQRVGRI